MKKKLKDLQKGDQVQLFTNLVPVPYPFEVTLIEMHPNDDRISALHLDGPNGDKRKYSFLHKEKELTMWTGFDVGSSYTESCPLCGRNVE